jgi:hypothetical protein
MDPFNPDDQRCGIVIGCLIVLGFLAYVYGEIRGYVRHRREMKRFRARLRWMHTPPAFRGPEPR